MFSESYVLRVLCSQSLPVMEAQKKKADAVLKAEAIRIEKERKQAIKQGYTNALILKRKCDKNRDALIVLAP